MNYIIIFCCLSGMVKEITGGYKIAYPANGPDQPPVIIDFTPPFRRISMLKGVEEGAGVKIPQDLASEGNKKNTHILSLTYCKNNNTPMTWGFASRRDCIVNYQSLKNIEL